MFVSRSFSRSRGFTLIETLSALLVFSLVTIGLVPLFLSSLRGPNLSRSYTIGKNVGVEAMERVRGLPLFVSRGAQNQAVDVLDLYYPRASGPGYAAGVYQTTCVGGARSAAALHCPRDVPTGYTVRFTASFVAANGQTVVLPPSDYDAALAGKDDPPSQLIRMAITTSWSIQGRNRSYTLTTLLAARSSDLRLSGVAILNHIVKVSTSYRSSQIYDLTALGGNVESRIETRSASVADQAVRPARLELVNATDPAAATQTLEGDTAVLHAPPTAPIAAQADAAGGVLSLLGQQVAGINRTLAGPSTPIEATLTAAADGEVPKASGGFDFTTADGGPSFWVDQPQAARGETPACLITPEECLRLLSGSRMVSMTSPLRGWASTKTGALGSFDRGVTGGAHAEFVELNLLPVQFANSPSGGPLLALRNFSADVACSATANAFSVSSSATWAGTLRYWGVSDPLTGVGGYVDVPVSSTLPLSIGNPLVYAQPRPVDGDADGDGDRDDDLNSLSGDLFLFPIADHGHAHEDGSRNHGGFLEELRVSSGTSRTDAQRGRTASATTAGNLGGALRIRTVPLPTAADSGYNPAPITLQIGSLECATEDAR